MKVRAGGSQGHLCRSSVTGSVLNEVTKASILFAVVATSELASL